MRKLLILLCLVVLCGMLLPQSALADTDLSLMSVAEIKNLIPKVHAQALKNTNRDTFSGYCGLYTKQQLKILGIGYVGTGDFTGKKAYDGLTDGAVTSSGYTQIKYKGKNCLSDIVAANNNEPVYNIVVSQTNTNNANGHVYFIYAIIGGTVYWSENSTWSDGIKEGQVRTNTIAQMQRPCQGSSYSIVGAVHFKKTEYTKIDSTARMAVSTKNKTGNAADDQCYIKETPFEDGKTVDVIAKGGVINVVGAVKNKHGNTWYKTETGDFVWSGDVEVYEIDWTELFKLNAKFTYNKAISSHVVPYTDSADAGSVSKGQTVTVKKFVTNKHGNIWAQLSDNSFVCFYDKNKDETYMTFKSHVTQPTHDTTYPTGNITVTADQGFWLKGPVTADVPFLTVSTRIIDRQTGKDVAAVGSPVTVNPAATAKKVELWVKNDSNCLDSRTLFKKLAGTSGWFTYQLNAQFGFKHEGKTFKFGNEMNLVSSNFSVGNPSTDEPPSDEQVIPVSCPSHLTISVGETYWFTSTATGEVSWEFTRGGELLSIEEEDGEYSLRPIKEGIAIVEYTGADGSKAKMGITIMPYTMYCEIYPEPSDDWNVVVTAGVNQSYKLYLLGPQDKYVSKPVWSVSDPSIANIVSVDDRICTVQATGNGTVMLRASVDILMEDGYLNPTETWTAELELSVKKPSNGESDNTPAITSSITMSAPTGLKADAGGTVTVPVSIINPTSEPMGSIVLEFALPDGVCISKAERTGIASNSAVQFKEKEYYIWITDMADGIIGSGQVLNVTFEMGENVEFPAKVTITPEICHLTQAKFFNPEPIVLDISEKEKARVPGDVNEDGLINSLDAFSVLKYSVGYSVSINTANADVNADGIINSLDAFMILKYSVGYTIELK